MSGTAAKAARRDIRRSFGVQGLDAVRQLVDEQANQKATIEFLRKTLNDERTHRLATDRQARDYVDYADRLIKAEFRHWTQRGLWARFRWLVTGR